MSPLAVLIALGLGAPLGSQPPPATALLVGKVLTVDASDRVHAPGLVLVEDGVIRYVGPPKDVPDGYRLLEYPQAWATPGMVDLHTHILPENWPDLRERYGCAGWPRLEHLDACSARMMIDQRHFRDVKHNCWDVSCRLDECDRAGVTAQVLSTVPVMFSYWSQPQHAHDLAQLLNDHVAEICRAHPHRFAGLGTLPMQSSELAIRELERCVQQLNLTGVQIGTHVNSWDLCDREIFVVLEAAVQPQDRTNAKILA